MDTGILPVKKNTILSLQAIRAITCFTVFIYHIVQISPLGKLSITVFFILSGFVMTFSYWDRPPEATGKSAIKFSINKIKPLFHLHVLMLLFGLVREILTSHDIWYTYAVRLLLTIPLLQTWSPVYYQALNVVDWYLSVTVFLYFAFPFLLAFLKNREPDTKNSLLLIVAIYAVQLITGAFVRHFFRPYTSWITYCFPIYRLGNFSIGCILGYLFRKSNTAIIKRPAATILEISAFLFVIASYIAARTVLRMGRLAWFTNTCFFIPSVACLIYVFAKEAGWLSRIITNRITLYFSGLTAWFFLMHVQVLQYLDQGVRYLFSITMSRWLLAVVAFPATLLAVKLYLLLRKKHYAKSAGQKAG